MIQSVPEPDRMAERIQERILEETADVRVPQVEEETDVVKLIPQMQAHNRMDEQIVDVTVPRFQERIVEVMKLIPLVEAQKRTGEPIIDMPVPLGEVIQFIPQARISDGIAEQIAVLPVPQVMEQNVKLVKDIPKERVQQRTEDQHLDVPVPPTRKYIGEVILPCPQEQISDRSGEQIVNVPGPQVWKKIEEVIQPILHRTSDRIGEQTVGEQNVDVPVLQIQEHIVEERMKQLTGMTTDAAAEFEAS